VVKEKPTPLGMWPINTFFTVLHTRLDLMIIYCKYRNIIPKLITSKILNCRVEKDLSLNSVSYSPYGRIFQTKVVDLKICTLWQSSSLYDKSILRKAIKISMSLI
jgi:hypothetical protein